MGSIVPYDAYLYPVLSLESRRCISLCFCPRPITAGETVLASFSSLLSVLGERGTVSSVAAL